MTFGKLQEYSWPLIRLVLGLILIFHGYAKLFGGIEGLTGFIAGVGFPAAALLAWLVALIEFVGGIAILVGFWTRPAALAVAVEFLFILVFFVRDKVGFGVGKAELEILIFATAIALLYTGAGPKWNLEEHVTGKEVWSG